MPDLPITVIGTGNAPNDPIALGHNLGDAIVLSGGGAKGDFEVGALRCLYNRGVRPKIVCGTSVGSVNALKLAEGETPSPNAPKGHVPGLAGLEKIWLDLNNDTNMWSLEPGVAAIFDALKKVPQEAAVLQKEAQDVQATSIFGVVMSVIGIPGFASFAPQLSDLSNLSDNAQAVLTQLTQTLTNAQNVQGFINYDPLEALMRQPSSFSLAMQQASGILVRLAMVALEDGALRYVNEKNQMIERNGALTKVPPVPTAAEIQAQRAKIQQLKNEIADAQPSGGGSLGPWTKPKPGIASKVNELGAAEGQLAAMLAAEPDLIRAAIASSSLPVICRPTPMQDGRTYVDGGIRTLAPIQAAIDAGASAVYAVAAGSQKFDSESLQTITTSLPLPLLGIALRVGEAILPDEVARRDLFPDNPWPVPVCVIQPDPSLDDIHDGLTLEPGLIRIRMAYGFMRAYDTLRAFQKFKPNFYQYAAQENSIKGRTQDIIGLRKRIWDLEFAALGKEFVNPGGMPRAPFTVKNLPKPDQAAHDQVKQLKAELSGMVLARIAYYSDAANNIHGSESLPADCSEWWTTWEKHSFTPAIPL